MSGQRIKPARRAFRGGPILCGKPSGFAEWRGLDWKKAPTCPNKATCYLNFGSDNAGGGWYLCDACTVLTIMWIEDYYEGQNPVWEREPIEPDQSKAQGS